MQDNEFDNLFRSKLDDFETEPSANVWQHIDAGLYAGNRRKLLVPLLSAAASIIVLVTAGILLMPQHVKNVPGHPYKTQIAMSDVAVKKTFAGPANNIAQVAAINTNKKPVKHSSVLQPVKKQPIIIQSTITKAIADQQPVVNKPVQAAIAIVPQKSDIIIKKKPNDTIALAANTISAPDITPIQAIIPDKQIIAKAAPQTTKKHRIHSLGDMLNTVIAAVDKRKDKLVEFTDTDDDESVVTGVNLGILAVKKQN